jgi:translation elongation factor P/translation initiation factor 5A
MTGRLEKRGGKVYRVTTLPDAKPPKGRSKKTRYKMRDVEKKGDK